MNAELAGVCTAKRKNNFYGGWNHDQRKKNIQALRDEEVDTVVGGALNQNIIAQYDLKSKDKKGLKVLYAKVEWAKGGSAVA